MRTLARLVGPTIHEVRGALNALQIHLELLSGALEAGGDEARERCRRHLEVLRAECARVSRMTGAFFDLAALPAEEAETDLGTMIAGALAAAQPLAVAHRVDLGGAASGTHPGGGLLVRERCRQPLLDAVLDAVGGAAGGAQVDVELSADGQWLHVMRNGAPCAEVRLDGVREPAGA